jgi:hypothetical protein
MGSPATAAPEGVNGAAAGYLAGLILATSPLFLALSRACVIDQTFSTLVAAGTACSLLVFAGLWTFRRGTAVLAAGALTFFPVFVSLLNGQDTALLVLGAILWLAGLLLECDPLAGLGLPDQGLRDPGAV